MTKEKKPNRKFTPEEIAKIREQRNTPHPDDPTKPKYTHSDLSEMWGVTGQRISGIVNNKLNPSEAYTPAFDGHRAFPRDENGRAIRKYVKAEKPAPDQEESTADPAEEPEEEDGEAELLKQIGEEAQESTEA